MVERDEDCHARRRELADLLARDFDIHHSTLQVEHITDEARLHTVRPGVHPPG